MSKSTETNTIIDRSPVVAVMGHIDHGKSTLLDYIRKTNIVDDEAGGITQHLSAYEVAHKDEKGVDKKITFLDTPGHAAFTKMRERGAAIADIAILIVSAEDGVKPQTVEAWKTITESKVPYIVAINKIDTPAANIEKTKTELAENEIYLEGYGGDVPYAEISAKTGAGVDSLLSLINIISELEELKGDPSLPGEGLVIEANLDSKRGMQATLIVKNGTLKKGMTVVVEDAICSTRIIENFKGKQIDKAQFSSPVRLVGFDKMPQIGSEFFSFEERKDALAYAKNWKEGTVTPVKERVFTDKKIIPIVLKADVSGSIEAIEKEIKKITNEKAEFRIIYKGEGPIGEKDIKAISDGESALVIGFNVKADASATDMAERRGITISFFEVIYKMTEWLEEEMEARRPRTEAVETSGRAKIIKAFSRTKERQIIGGKVTEGSIKLNKAVKIIRREFEIGKGKIVNLEKGKIKTGEVLEGDEFGMMVESKIEIVGGDVIESFNVVQR